MIIIIIFRMARVIPFENFRIVSDLTWQQVPARAVVSECGKDRSVVVHWKQKGGASLFNNNIEGCGRQRGGETCDRLIRAVLTVAPPRPCNAALFWSFFFLQLCFGCERGRIYRCVPLCPAHCNFFLCLLFFFFGSSCRKVIFMTFSRLALCCSFPFVWMRTRSPIRSAALKNGQVLVVVTCFTGGWWM